MRSFLLVIIICGSWFMPALARSLATTIYSDGGSHTIAGTSDNISLQNATTLNVVDGASIGAPFQIAAISATDHTANAVTVTGGSMTTASDLSSGGVLAGFSIDMYGGSLHISGGTFTGGDASFIPGGGIRTVDTDVEISGGEFHGGGNAHGYQGNGIEISGGNAQISGGTFEAGTSADYALGGIGAAFGVGYGSTRGHVLISGGTFEATPGFPLSYSLAVGYDYSALVEIKGGLFIGDILIAGEEIAGLPSELDIYGTGLTATASSDGEYVSGFLLDGTRINVDVLYANDESLFLHNTPEPATLILAAVSGIALGVYARSRWFR